MTAEQLIAFGNKRVLEIVATYTGFPSIRWCDWMRKNGWKFMSSGSSGDLWSNKSFIGWVTERDAFVLELKMAMFDTKAVVNRLDELEPVGADD